MCVSRMDTTTEKKNIDRKEKIGRSRTAYENAVKVAREAGYEYRAIDALVNLAWLYYYAGDFTETRDILEKKVRNQMMMITYIQGNMKRHVMPPLLGIGFSLAKPMYCLG